MPSRRGFLAGLGTALTPRLGWAALGDPVALSAARAPDGSFELIGLTEAGDIAFRNPLPARGHAAAAHPHKAEAVAIARRPGRFAQVIDCATGALRQTLHAPKGRHFYGHGAFSADGRLLFTTENDFTTGAGRIGVWDRSLGYLRVDEFASHGIGPHEILRLPSGDLAVANGGIRTHPDTGREKLNLETMRPNLAIFSALGVLRDLAEAPDPQNSLRHIAATPGGTVICGFQWQGDPYDVPPLVALYRDGLQMAEMQTHGLNGYIGSVSATPDGGFAASAPRGNRVVLFDSVGTQSAVHHAPDICGLCLGHATDGTGRVYTLGQTLGLIRQHDLAFDNHLVRLT